MTKEELEEKLRQVKAQLRKAKEAQKAKEKELSEQEEAMKQANQKLAQISGEMGTLASEVIARLASFSRLRFHDIYSGGFHNHYTTRTDGWMGQSFTMMAAAKSAFEKLEEEKKEQDSLVARLQRKVEELKREIEKAGEGT